MNGPNPHLIHWPRDRVEMAFHLIPDGNFRMGSRGYNPTEEPAHEVEISEPFWMAETPVTQAQFALWTRAERVDHKYHFEGHPDHPAENMNWRQAVAFCDWLTRTKGTEFPEGFRLACLPTEAEWEYACRAWTDTEYYTGDGPAALAEAGWFGEKWDSGSTHPVKLKKANEFGLYDMHGNVWEWCHDVWNATAYRGHEDGATDAGTIAGDVDWRSGLPSMVASNDHRVLRGGSWSGPARSCRSAYRDGNRPADRDRRDGFRVCLVLGPTAARSAKVGRPSHQPESQKESRSEPRETESEGAGEGGADIGDLARANFPREAGRKIS